MYVLHISYTIYSLSQLPSDLFLTQIRSRNFWTAFLDRIKVSQCVINSGWPDCTNFFYEFFSFCTKNIRILPLVRKFFQRSVQFSFYGLVKNPYTNLQLGLLLVRNYFLNRFFFLLCTDFIRIYCMDFFVCTDFFNYPDFSVCTDFSSCTDFFQNIAGNPVYVN